MIVLAIILLILGLVFHPLWIIGIILLVVGLVLWFLGSARTGGRRWY